MDRWPHSCPLPLRPRPWTATPFAGIGSESDTRSSRISRFRLGHILCVCISVPFTVTSYIQFSSHHIALAVAVIIYSDLNHAQPKPYGVGLAPDLARHYWVDFCYGVAVGDPTSKPVLTWKHNNCRRPKRRQWNICPLGQILKYIYQRNTLNTMLKNMDQSVLSLGYVRWGQHVYRI